MDPLASISGRVRRPPVPPDPYNEVAAARHTVAPGPLASSARSRPRPTPRAGSRPWVDEVIKGTVLVTIAPATASWLYATDTVPARSPTLSAAVCLGSLIKFILPTLCRPLNGRHDARDHNPIVLILALVSAYVFVHVAMHGDTYLGSARKTSALLGTLMQSNVVVSIMTAVLFVTAAAPALCPFLPLWCDPPCGARGNGRLPNPPRHGSPVWMVPSQPSTVDPGLCSSSSFEMERSAPRVGRNSTCSSAQRRTVWRPRR
jgi:hypothetical protein